jgi:predicted branched-subunit amino acid permease
VATSPTTPAEPPRSAKQPNEFLAGTIDMLPLSLAVLPWGILAGSMAVEAGLSFSESIAMSALVYAGAAQLVSLTMIKSGVGAATILISVFFITLQHLLYGLTLRENVTGLKARYRFSIGFLLTDELFALTGAKTKSQFNVSYALGAGLSFYLFWNLFSLIGILIASSVPDLAKFHLDFSIIATFIAIVVPMVKRLSTLVGVIISLILSMLFSYLKVPGAIIFSGVIGMFCAVAVGRVRGER